MSEKRMNNFQFQNPTKIVFGEGEIATIAKEIPADSKVLMLYGGGSIKLNGVYDQVKSALANFDVVEMGGIPANPEYKVLLDAVEIVKKEKIDFLLAVGGGSVIDGTKFVAAASLYNGDSWDMVKNGTAPEKAIPFGTILTLPATGSEMNSGSVITREETAEKFAFMGPSIYPQFSILDPTVIASLPKKQISNGLADAFVHVLEQYATYPVNAMVQDRFAESIMKNLIDISAAILDNPKDYVAASNFMFSCTMALNGLISVGVPQDWSTHAIGHELTALFGIDHACTLAILSRSYLTHNLENKKEKLAQLAERVFDIKEGSTEEKALKAIDSLDAFFHSINIKTKLSEYTDNYEIAAKEISERFTNRGWMGMGEKGDITPTNVASIVTGCY